MTNHLKVGIIAAPERAEDIINHLAEYLPNEFSIIIDSDIEWDVSTVVNPLTGAAETAHDILHNASLIKQQKVWDYAICLTDLPIFHNGNIVAADISFIYQVAQISLPSYGWPPMQKRIKKTIIHILGNMYAFDSIEQTQDNQPVTYASTRFKQIKQSNRQPFKKGFPIKPVKRQDNPVINGDTPIVKYDEIQQCSKKALETDESSRDKGGDVNQDSNTDNEPNSGKIDVRFLIYPKFFGLLRIVLGMTFANNPLKIMSSFKSVIAIAFTTGTFALIFPTIWKWGQIFSLPRLTTMMIAAILGLVVWIIAVHHLWESPSSNNKPSIRRLYNTATLSTLVIDASAYYIVLYILFLATAVIFIPPDYLKTVTPDSQTSILASYTRVAWAEASISTIVSAMGAGLENEEKVRNITYGYRQSQRYNETAPDQDTE